jgi:Family of unknown function (DUF6152)
MKTYRIVALMLMTLPLGAQTAAELLQKGIYDQETAGDLDGAIAVYRQIVNSGSSPRDVAAQAQYRLAQSLLQKGDLPNGAQEFSNLARNYADYGKLVSNLATQARANTFFFNPSTPGSAEERANADRMKALAANLQALEAQRVAAGATSSSEQQAKAAALLAEIQGLKAQQAYGVGGGGRGGGRSMTFTASSPPTGVAAMSFDPASPVSVTGAAVSKVEWVNPNATISVDPKDGSGKRYTFLMASPNMLIKQGMTRVSLKPGDEVTVTGIVSTGGQILPDGTIAASASTITRADGRQLFDRAALPALSNVCNWVSATVPPPCPAQ